MTIIEGEFVQHKPSWNYKDFRSEFVRKKRQTSYQRVHEGAECERERKAVALAAECPPTADGVPHWADYQIAPGIMNTVHTWQAERYQDPNSPETKIRFTQSALDQVRNIYSGVEPFAIENVEYEALTWTASRGRTYLTPQEHRVLQLSKRYMGECDRFEFKARNPGFEPSYHDNGELVVSIMYRWISRTTGFSVKYIEAALVACENVYRMCDVLGMESAPSVRVPIAPVKRTEIVAEEKQQAA
jgi:hypothetical protein